MDPNTAIDLLKEHVQTAEKFLRAATRAPTASQAKTLHRDARESLDDASETLTGLWTWRARGGFMPRRYDTWVARYTEAEKQWSRQSKVL